MIYKSLMMSIEIIENYELFNIFPIVGWCHIDVFSGQASVSQWSPLTLIIRFYFNSNARVKAMNLVLHSEF